VIGRSPARRKLAFCLVSLAAGLALLEASFRWVLFGNAAELGIGGALRHSSYYADPRSDDDFWKLHLVVEKLQAPIPSECYHPLLGWVSAEIDRRTLAHCGNAWLAGRRPILLYGDSYAQCMTGPDSCFQGFLRRTELVRRYCLLNYGVAGYGLDQICLLFEGSIDGYAEMRPLVVISLLLDDSLDRSVLHLRGWPKPRFVIAEEGLVLEQVPVPSIEALLEREPLGIRSYAWRYGMLRAKLLPECVRAWATDVDARTAEKIELNRQILVRLADAIERQGCECFFLLFQTERSTFRGEDLEWRRDLVVDFLRERGIPFLETADALREHARANGLRPGSYFSHGGATADHFLPLANEIAFGVLRDGIEGRFPSSD
jgi:hypothetical protein